MKRMIAFIALAALLMVLVGCAAGPAAPTVPTTTRKTRPVWQTGEDTSCFPLRLYHKNGTGVSEMEIYPDGSFEGVYTAGTITIDQDTGMASGEMDHCKFDGEFSTFTKRDAYSYELTVRELRLQRAVGEQWNENGGKYTAVEAYGLTDVTACVLYLPGTPADMLPEEVKAVAVMNETMPMTLTGYCLMTDKKTVFVSVL